MLKVRSKRVLLSRIFTLSLHTYTKVSISIRKDIQEDVNVSSDGDEEQENLTKWVLRDFQKIKYSVVSAAFDGS
ncbi:hypothetical protein Cal6303_3206 [Calothrix sp. PCC 6303]|nr:hypothetical protein Cal6303_3206 [Calothrix sp. PCC 6303]